MELSQIRVTNFLISIKDLFDNSINKFAKINKVNVNQYYAIVRGERPFGDKVARSVEKMIGLNSGDLDKIPEKENGLNFDYPLIVEGEPIPKDPMTSLRKRKVSSQSLPNILLEQMEITKKNIFIVEFKTTLFYPMINPYGVWVVEKFSGTIVSGGYYLLNSHNKFYVYKIEENIISRSFFDEKNSKIIECPTNENNDTVRSIIGRLRFGIIAGII